MVLLGLPGSPRALWAIKSNLDAQIVPVDIAAEYSLRSTVISEAIAANRLGYRVASGDSQWSSMVSNLRVPDHGFLALMDRTKRSFELVIEDESKPNKKRFSNLKHALRFEMYQRRYGSGDVTDPRLSATEREKWLAMLERRRGELGI